MPLPFESLREQLLRAGVTPHYASRYAAELREHLADLIEQERASGLDVEQATERARALVGSEADLARATIEKGALRSVTVRAPWAMFVLLPVVLWMAVLSADVISMMHLLWPVRGFTPSEMPESYRALIALGGFIARYLVGVLLAAGCIAVALRQRLASGWIWVGLGLIALLTGIIGFYVHVIPPRAGDRGSAVYSLAALIYRHGRVNLAATLDAWALHAAALFAMAAAGYHILRVRLMPDSLSSRPSRDRYPG
ncbi:MAG: hypothetical protein ACREUG_01520 [Steroidobacteraceae bacterium]